MAIVIKDITWKEPAYKYGNGEDGYIGKLKVGHFAWHRGTYRAFNILGYSAEFEDRHSAREWVHDGLVRLISIVTITEVVDICQ